MVKNPPCPTCQNTETPSKVISAGMPFWLCTDDRCNTVWGFWSYPYAWFVAPLEGFFSGGFMFYTYQGSYIKALWHWFKQTDDTEENY